MVRPWNHVQVSTRLRSVHGSFQIVLSGARGLLNLGTNFKVARNTKTMVNYEF